jgi:DegV family protein with EDD domain
MGTALQIKPVLCLDDGHVEVFAKPRTRRRAIRLVLREMTERIGRHPIHIAVFHADVPEEAEVLRQKIAERFNCVELYVVEFTPVMGIHTGPGVLGVVFYPE